METDSSLSALRQHLSLCEKLLQVRLAKVTNQPKGRVMRHNQITHTQTMLGLLSVMRGLAAHDPLNWWDSKDDVPF